MTVEKPDFSDHPAMRSIRRDGFGLAKTSVLFPLSNELALLGAFEGEQRHGDLAERVVAMVNGTVITSADKQVYAAADDFAWSMQHTTRIMRGSELLNDQAPPAAAAESAEVEF